jgi:uncharacterized membrane protein YeiH
MTFAEPFGLSWNFVSTTAFVAGFALRSAAIHWEIGLPTHQGAVE